MAEALRFAGRILSGVVSEQGGQWFISITVELEAAPQRQRDASTVAAVGIDLGVKRLATLSDGTHVENQNVLRATLNKLKRLNRELARRQPGSNHWWKTKRKLQRLHARIRNQRLDFIHKMTHAHRADLSADQVEDLHVAGMVRNRRLALSLADAAMGEIANFSIRQLGLGELCSRSAVSSLPLSCAAVVAHSTRI
ncbi:MAG: transposase [Caldilineaceae bacterium]